MALFGAILRIEVAVELKPISLLKHSLCISSAATHSESPSLPYSLLYNVSCTFSCTALLADACVSYNVVSPSAIP